VHYNLQQFIDSINEADEGSDVIAFFDFDKTLIAGYSAAAFIWQQLKSGKLGPTDIRNQLAAARNYTKGSMNFSDFVVETSQFLKGQTEDDLAKHGEIVYKKSIHGAIYPEARALIEAHQARGHTVAIVSSATYHQIAPAARELEIEHILCTELEMVDGVFTGEIIHPSCFGKGKKLAADNLCNELGADIDISFFYTDSEDDLPLIDGVGNPRIVNPSKTLGRLARKHQWPICKFADRGRPGLMDVAKMGSVYTMMPTAMAAAMPLWALTGNKRKAINTAMSFWADYASALTGLTYDIDGEEHLYEQRPAVFIFNHQSSADTVIIAKLLKKDFTGIGKKEIARMPIVGPVFKFADVILIDRSDGKKAIETMKPVVNALKHDKLSVVLAPEGTRSYGTHLGKFKKGAFHIAIQAGVPVVPIVIHNAADTLPRGRQIARAADIKVTVLPPIDVSKWKLSQMNAHVAKVRDMFVETLGQSG